MDARSYIEAIARELARSGGRGLVLSPADARLALGWHADGVPLDSVVAELRRAVRPAPPVARGATALRFSLQFIEAAIVARRPR